MTLDGPALRKRAIAQSKSASRAAAQLEPVSLTKHGQSPDAATVGGDHGGGFLAAEGGGEAGLF